MTDSQRLLADYVQTGSDLAFRDLVTRYVDLVYSTALRLVDGDAHRAQDVTQTVFVDLTRTARTLSAGVLLGGWLHRHTCFVAANVMRGERRRQTRERQAMEMNALQTAPEPDFKRLAPLLDEAINELSEADRTAILLRFFEQHDFRAIGQALASNEDAARMRVNRALEKLQELLKRRGLTSSAAALSVVLSANAVQAAPVGLALTVATAAALTGTTLATTATVTATKAITMTALQKTIVTATIAVLVGAGIYEARQASQLRGQLQTLQQQAMLANETTTSLSQEQSSESTRLRNEIEQLQSRLNDAEQKQTNRLTQANAAPREFERFVASGIALQKKQWEEEAQGQLASLKEQLKLSPEQESAIRDLMMNRVELRYESYTSGSPGSKVLSSKEHTEKRDALLAIEPQIVSMLTSDQQAAYTDYKEELSIARGRTRATAELAELQNTFSLTMELQDKIYPTLYELAVKEIGNNLLNPSQNSYEETFRSLEQRTNQLSRKLELLAGVLPQSQTEQLERYRQTQERRIEILKRSLALLKPPTETNAKPQE